MSPTEMLRKETVWPTAIQLSSWHHQAAEDDGKIASSIWFHDWNSREQIGE